MFPFFHQCYPLLERFWLVRSFFCIFFITFLSVKTLPGWLYLRTLFLGFRQFMIAYSVSIPFSFQIAILFVRWRAGLLLLSLTSFGSPRVFYFLVSTNRREARWWIIIFKQGFILFLVCSFTIIPMSRTLIFGFLHDFPVQFHIWFIHFNHLNIFVDENPDRE